MGRHSALNKRMENIVRLVTDYQNAALHDDTMPDVKLYLWPGGEPPAIQIAPDENGVGLYGGGKRKPGEGFRAGVDRVRSLLTAYRERSEMEDGQAYERTAGAG